MDVVAIQAEKVSQRRKPNPAVVVATERVTPHMRRLALYSEAFRSYSVPLPGQWVKFIIPTDDGEPGEGRAYTIRSIDQAKGVVEIDFVIHGDGGPVSNWATAAAIGDTGFVGGPRGGHRIDTAAQWRLLMGDETALPAIASILAMLSEDRKPVQIVVEVPSADDVQRLSLPSNADIQWLPRAMRGVPGILLAKKVAGMELPAGVGQVFAAGEANAIKQIKKDLLQRMPAAKLDAKGYWLLGASDHRD